MVHPSIPAYSLNFYFFYTLTSQSPDTQPLSQGKLKTSSRKPQSQSTKSLYLDHLPTNMKKRKNKFNSGEVRFKSGDSMESTRIISKSALDSLFSQKGNKKLSKFPEQPLNDRHYGEHDNGDNDDDDVDITRELPTSIYEYDKTNTNRDGGDDNDEDDDEYEDPSVNEEYIKAYKHGDDPNKILNSWTNRKKLLPSSSSATTTTTINLNANLPQQTSSSHLSKVIDLPENGGSNSVIANSGILGSGLLNRLPGPPHDLVAQIIKPRFVTLSWLEPVKNPVEVVSYTVYYKMNNSER